MQKENRSVKHKIEIFSAGCQTCKDAIEVVRKLAGSEHQVVVHDMHQQTIASRAAQHGIRSVPAVVIDGKVAGCCAGRGIDEQVIRDALR
jgi:glutaredoxin